MHLLLSLLHVGCTVRLFDDQQSAVNASKPLVGIVNIVVQLQFQTESFGTTGVGATAPSECLPPQYPPPR